MHKKLVPMFGKELPDMHCEDLHIPSYWTINSLLAQGYSDPWLWHTHDYF